MTSASARCAVSRNCDTRGSSTSPLWTMYQPIAPCSPPSTKIAGELPRVAGRNPAAHGKPDERQQEHHADRAAEQPVEILPPEDALELRERHALVDLPVFGRRAGTWRRSPATARRFSGGSVPTIGCHSVIDSPECVSRVTPPTTTIANTSAQQTNSQAATGDSSGRGRGAPACAGKRHGCAVPMTSRFMSRILPQGDGDRVR